MSAAENDVTSTDSLFGDGGRLDVAHTDNACFKLEALQRDCATLRKASESATKTVEDLNSCPSPP